MSRDRARQLRKNMTETEQFVWGKLRQRQLGGCKFRRQMPLGPYIVDFVCLEARLILELDGGQHAEQQEKDAVRTQWLERQGFVLMRFWNHQALQEWDAIEKVIWEHLQKRVPVTTFRMACMDLKASETQKSACHSPLHPNPSPQGGRE